MNLPADCYLIQTISTYNIAQPDHRMRWINTSSRQMYGRGRAIEQVLPAQETLNMDIGERRYMKQKKGTHVEQTY